MHLKMFFRIMNSYQRRLQAKLFQQKLGKTAEGREVNPL